MKKLRTYVLRGGQPCSLNREGMPTHHHNGRLSLWQAALDRTDHAAVLFYFASQGVEVELGGPDRRQKQRREKWLEATSGKTLFPTAQCPQCYFLDLHSETLCGYMDWPEERVGVGVESPDGQESLARCPLHDMP